MRNVDTDKAMVRKGKYGLMPRRMKSAQCAAFLFALVLAMEAPALTVFASSRTNYSTYEDYLSGNSSGERPGGSRSTITVEIHSEEDLKALAENCRLASWSEDKYIKLGGDITLEEYTDITIPSFAGIFDGGGHKITNLHLVKEGSAQGLFRVIQQGGEVRGLKVEGKVAPEGSKSQAGGIAGINYGLIYNCSFSGSVEGDNDIGGIAGLNESTGEIRKCNSCAVINGNHSAGGITGNNRGTINNCSNEGDINTYSTEVTYNIDDITMDSFEDINSTANVSAHTDSGGIAGISEGKIYYCTNSGTVGYSHVGYNSGGIVGRLSQGYLQNCTNTGHVLGRKDVGGIAGQMEPFLEIQYLNDKLTELDHELDYTIDLISRLNGNLQGYGQQASVISRNLTTNLKNVSSAAGTLTSTGSDLWYIYNQELTGVANDMKVLGSDMESIGGEKNQDNSGNDSNNDKQNDSSVSSGDIEDAIQDAIDGKWELPDREETEAYKAALEKFGKNTGKHLENMTGASGDRAGSVKNSLNVLDQEMGAAVDHLGQLMDVLNTGSDQAGSDMDALVEQARVLRRLLSDIRDDLFSYEGITVKDTSDEAASKELAGLGATEGSGEASGPKSGDTKAEGENGSMDEKADTDGGDGQVSDSAADREQEDKLYDTSSFQKGKITRCINKGLVEADTNAGGIVGQIATEFDFDPEDDITLSGTESFDIEQTVKAVVRESRNLGNIVSKKDCAGGIVGRAEFGAVISCESYGSVSSTGGSNVGGIAGLSSYAIRSCYSMGNLKGNNHVGGIAGKGSDIFYSCAMNTLEAEGEGRGAIAGSVAPDGTLYGNYYVNELEGGIDGIGYTGGAEPVEYDRLCLIEGLPNAFTSFTVIFQAEGKELASYTCRYGDSLSAEQIPAIPEKEGYYGVWPEFDFGHVTSNRVLEAVYKKWVGSIAGSETDDNGMALLLVEGEFLPESELLISRSDNETSFRILCDEEDDTAHPAGMEKEYRSAVRVHVLCGEEAAKTSVQVLTQEGNYKNVEAKVLGSYLVFDMDQPGNFRLNVEQNTISTKWIIAGGAIAAVGAVIAIMVRVGKKGIRNKGKSQKENA